MNRKRPIAYLDVDDTILRHPSPGESLPPPGVADFLRFLARNFEVRWLTRWCPGGRMREDQLALLSGQLGIPADELRSFVNPGAFIDGHVGTPAKWPALDWHAIDRGRPFVWIENALGPEDRAVLQQRGLLHRFIPCDVTANPLRLLRLLERPSPLHELVTEHGPEFEYESVHEHEHEHEHEPESAREKK